MSGKIGYWDNDTLKKESKYDGENELHEFGMEQCETFHYPTKSRKLSRKARSARAKARYDGWMHKAHVPFNKHIGSV